MELDGFPPRESRDATQQSARARCSSLLLGARAFITKSSPMPMYTLVVHGGAGIIGDAVKRHGEFAYRAALHAALEAGQAILANGGTALDAVEAAAASMQ